MFSKFLKSFGVNMSITYTDNFYKDFFDNFGGMQFGNGLFNAIRLEEIGKWEEYIVDAFPKLAGKILPFGYTWDGVFLCIDVRDGKIFVCDVASSECYWLGISLEDFLNNYIPEAYNKGIFLSEYQQWIAKNGPLPYGYCAGWIVPLFLNGKAERDNQELIDMEVYWGVTGQIRQQVMGDYYGKEG